MRVPGSILPFHRVYHQIDNKHLEEELLTALEQEILDEEL
jgi:hypothetical protein